MALVRVTQTKVTHHSPASVLIRLSRPNTSLTILTSPLYGVSFTKPLLAYEYKTRDFSTLGGFLDRYLDNCLYVIKFVICDHVTKIHLVWASTPKPSSGGIL